MKYGIIEEVVHQTWIEGDERSRTNPGHGYPGGYETHRYTTLVEFEGEEALKEHLKWKGVEYARKARVIAFEPVKIDAEVTLRVGG